MLLYSFRMVGFTSSISVEEGNAKFILPRGMEISKATTTTDLEGLGEGGWAKKEKTPINQQTYTPTHSD